uniref:hypothetical protein n=1 Tax=Scandinavium goeteborgense TaxID=1851514 RepID=UPI00135B51BF|nr:hypothetical protein [Scandinavium goeteborgense]
MLSLTNAWQCDIWPHLLRLRLGERVVAVQARADGESLDATLDALLAQRPSSLSWRDSVAFHLDTDDLMFMVQPWLPGVATPQELLRLSQQQADSLRQREDWQVRFESAGWQQPALVACLQQQCWSSLRTLAKRQRLRFHGVATPFQPLLQHCRGKLPENGLFVTIGSHHSRIASRVYNAWQDVSTLSLPRREIRSQLRIIARLSGMSDCPQYVINTDDRQPQIITPQETRV